MRPLSQAVLLAGVVFAHPRWVADDRSVVRRDPQFVGEVVRPLDRRDPPPGPLAVDGDQQQRVLRHRGTRLDEALDALAGLGELPQVLLIGVARSAHRARLVPATEPLHGKSVPYHHNTRQKAFVTVPTASVSGPGVARRGGGEKMTPGRTSAIRRPTADQTHPR